MRRKELQGTNLLSIEVPGGPDLGTLEAIIASLYTGSIELGPDNLEHVLRTANAMQVSRPPVTADAGLLATKTPESRRRDVCFNSATPALFI